MRFISLLMIVDLPLPDGAENIMSLDMRVMRSLGYDVNFLFLAPQMLCYKTLSTCSFICSSSSFILTTMFCISA